MPFLPWKNVIRQKNKNSEKIFHILMVLFFINVFSLILFVY